MKELNKLSIYILLALSIGMCVLLVFINLKGNDAPDTVLPFWNFLFIFISIMWAYSDSKQKRFHMPFEFGFLAYMLWIIVFPWYIFSTRGSRGIILFLGFLFLWLAPWLTEIVVYAYLTS